MHWSSIPIHIIDFEGTKTSGILEYGIVTLQDNTIIQAVSRLCRPIGFIAPQDIRQHGITATSVKDHLPFSHEWDLFASLRSSGPLAAHHAQTENMLLKSVWPYPRTSPNFINPQQPSTSWGPWIDTCQLFKNLYPQLNSYKLMDLISTFELFEKLSQLVEHYCPLSRNKHHCALYDALASTVLLQYILALPQLEDIITLNWLLINSASQEKRSSLEQYFL